MINYDMNIRNPVFTTWSENVFNPPSNMLNGQITIKIDNRSKYVVSKSVTLFNYVTANKIL